MNGRMYAFRAPTNPLAQFAALVVFGVLLVAAVVMGAFILVVLIGIVAIAAVVLAVRGWWLRRKLGADGGLDGTPGAVPRGPAPPSGRVIDAEYEVIEHRPSRADPKDAEPRP